MPNGSPPITWDDDVVTIDGVRFASKFPITDSSERFHIRKPAHMVQRTIEFAQKLAGKNLVELGIAGGGSVALYSLVANPCRFLAVELDPHELPGLKALLETRGVADRVVPIYGVDQADRLRLDRLCDEVFGEEPLDFILDDASHLLQPTTASFEVLFGRLRPGCEFVIEDWRGQHQMAVGLDQVVADPSHPDHAPFMAALDAERAAGRVPDDPDLPLSVLIMQILLAQACGSGAIERVIVEPHWVRVVRGTKALPATWTIRDEYTDHFNVLPPTLLGASS